MNGKKLFVNPYLLRHEMSYYPNCEYPPPGHQPDPCCQTIPVPYPPQPSGPVWVSPVYTIPPEPAPILRHPVHRVAQYPHTGHRPGADETSPLPRRASYRKGSERELSKAYDHPSSQSKLKDQFRIYDQHGDRLEQPHPPTKAIGCQARKQIDQQAWYSDVATTVLPNQESSRDNLDGNGKEKKKLISSQRVRTKGEPEEQKKPTSSQRVHTKGEPKEQIRIRKWVRSLPEGLDEEAKESSEDTAGTERKHTTEKATNSQRARTKCGSSKPDHVETRISKSQPDAKDKQIKENPVIPAVNERKHAAKQPAKAPHPETDSMRRPEKPGVQAKERTSTNTAGAGRANTTTHSTGTKFSVRPTASHSGPEITINEHKDAPINLNYDPKRSSKVRVSMPDEKSMSHQGKEKPKEFSQGSHSKKSTKEEVPGGKKKPKESSRGSRSKKLTAENVPDYYAILGCSILDDTATISTRYKKTQLKFHPDKCRIVDMSEQKISEITSASALINVAGEILKDPTKRRAYDQVWDQVYRMDNGKTVPR